MAALGTPVSAASLGWCLWLILDSRPSLAALGMLAAAASLGWHCWLIPDSSTSALLWVFIEPNIARIRGMPFGVLLILEILQGGSTIVVEDLSDVGHHPLLQLMGNLTIGIVKVDITQ